MKDDTVYLKYILECIQKIEEDIACGPVEFKESHLHQDAVLRNLHTISESTQRISEKLKNKNPNVEWRSIAAFRNILVHDYFGIDIGKVWQVVSEDIPQFKKNIIKMLMQVEKKC